MTYRVLDNGRPAKCPECKVDPSWNHCDFQTWEEAQEYARRWLGLMNDYFVPQEADKPVVYSAANDTIEICRVI